MPAADEHDRKAEMIYFSMSLRDGEGAIQKLGMLPFASLSDVRDDVLAGLLETAVDLLRDGKDPALYDFLICDIDGQILLEIPVGTAKKIPASDVYGKCRSWIDRSPSDG